MTATALPSPRMGRTTEELSIGSLCTGYAGLDMGVAAALGGTARLVWVADNDPHVGRLLAARFPDVPNLGDLATVHWADVSRPDVIAAGFPCQDISAPVRGAGIEKGTRSSVWHHVMHAARHLRPNLLVLENVAALRWKGRGFDRVLADLARTGYDARWCSVRASDVGAFHRRERVFVAAHLVCQRCHQGKSPAARFTRQLQTALRGHRYAHEQYGTESPPFAYAWGEYEPAIQRWEAALGRSAPAPTEVGTRGQPRLSAALVEWVMGLPSGWVTDLDIGLPRTAQLQALGDGVVPQQAQAAVRHLLASSPAFEAGGPMADHRPLCVISTKTKPGRPAACRGMVTSAAARVGSAR